MDSAGCGVASDVVGSAAAGLDDPNPEVADTARCDPAGDGGEREGRAVHGRSEGRKEGGNMILQLPKVRRVWRQRSQCCRMRRRRR